MLEAIGGIAIMFAAMVVAALPWPGGRGFVAKSFEPNDLSDGWD